MKNSPNPELASVDNQAEKTNAKIGIYTELLFALVPLIWILLILWYQKKTISILFVPEWSFTAALLSGQTITKFIAGLLVRQNANNVKVLFILTLLILFLLSPSLLLLTLVQLSEKPDTRLAIAQLVMFLASLICFRVVGAAGQQMIESEQMD